MISRDIAGLEKHKPFHRVEDVGSSRITVGLLRHLELYEHATAPRAVDPPTLELNVNAPIRNREVSRQAGALVVAALAAMPAAGTHPNLKIFLHDVMTRIDANRLRDCIYCDRPI